MNNSHQIIIEAYRADDARPERIGIAVTCECSVLLLEVEGNEEVQTTLDLIQEARFAHYEEIVHEEPVCAVCGDCQE